MRDFRNLEVWKKSHEMTLALYQVTDGFPKDELFGLTSQIRRSGVSISANIAEGCGRQGEAELARFLQIAMGSASELDCHLLLTKDLRYMNADNYNKLHQDLSEVRRMLTSLLEAIENSANRLKNAKTAAVAKG